MDNNEGGFGPPSFNLGIKKLATFVAILETIDLIATLFNWKSKLLAYGKQNSIISSSC